MALYESVFIARQDISSSQVDALADGFQKIIEDGGGQVPKRENWGLRSLAYKIKKNRKGHYVLFNIDSPSEAVMEYERNMKLNEDILRYLILRVDELDGEPSVVMQGRGRSERGERGERGRRFEERPKDGDRRPDAAEAKATEPAKSKAAEPTEAKASEPTKSKTAEPGEAKAAEPAKTQMSDAEAANEKAPKTAAKTAKPKTAKSPSAKKTDGDKKDGDKEKDAKPAKSANSAADGKKDKKTAPAKKLATAKEDKKAAVVKKTAAKKKGEKS